MDIIKKKKNCFRIKTNYFIDSYRKTGNSIKSFNTLHVYNFTHYFLKRPNCFLIIYYGHPNT